MVMEATAINARGELECSCCHLLAEYRFKGKVDGKTVLAFSCSNPLHYEDARIMVGGSILEDK